MPHNHNHSCNVPCYSSTSNTAWRRQIGGYPIKYGGGGGPDDYTVYSQRFDKDANFLATCDNWAKNLAFFSRRYRGSDIRWIGHIGTTTSNRCSWHRHSRAWDLNQIRWRDGSRIYFVKPGTSWKGTRKKKRFYLAVDASLQRYFPTTIDAYSDPGSHYNHIHVDMSCGSVSPPQTPWGTYSDDTKFIQALCNNFSGAGIAVDGYWGTNTRAAWRTLRGRLNMNCRAPLQNSSDWRVFLSYIMRHGLANRAAGYWKYSGC